VPHGGNEALPGHRDRAVLIVVMRSRSSAASSDQRSCI
jgi:hypothetical protein